MAQAEMISDDARRALGQVYRLLLRLAEDNASGSENPPQEPALPPAQDSAQGAPSPKG
jgi:hypothetical protein